MFYGIKSKKKRKKNIGQKLQENVKQVFYVFTKPKFTFFLLHKNGKLSRSGYVLTVLENIKFFRLFEDFFG